MFEFIIGIILGATFADFWRYLYSIARNALDNWMGEYKAKKNSTE